MMMMKVLLMWRKNNIKKKKKKQKDLDAQTYVSKIERLLNDESIRNVSTKVCYRLNCY
jgi:hypothetical protein